ncbi:isoprenoid synthase domain-containing protein [Aspergillus cavernicola]|uniref:Isoprenoid synthase domain-containing protein n=1 Tax=Aspergillus cavernicola TaxID=176166 RepID=A0ABR4J1C3_9EURO
MYVVFCHCFSSTAVSVSDTSSALLRTTLSDEQYKDLATLGWSTELLQVFFLVSDDLMDGSVTRRGQPCWYRQPGVNLITINDAFLLESGIYIILKKQFCSHPAYIDLLCDLITAPEDEVDLDNFSMEKYMFIVTYKITSYSFYLPVALALIYLQLATAENLQQAYDILISLGQYFQVLENYLNAYSDPQFVGKIGTDIQDNKCSWIVNQALQRCSAEHRKLLDTAYGHKDDELEAKIKEEYEEKIVGEIKTKITAVDETQGLKEVFEAFLGKIYKRSK